MSIIETGIYKSAENDPNEVEYVGQKTAREVFNELKRHLESENKLPEEYFLLNSHFENGELFPENASIMCCVNWGGNEGILLDVMLRVRNDKGELQYRPFAFGKTLGETDEDFDQMYLIAAECTKVFHSPVVHNRFIMARKSIESDDSETDDNAKFANLINSLTLEKRFRPALHIDWEDIDDTATELLSSVLNREIKATANRSDYYCWSISVYETPLTESETEKLNELFGADEYDRGIQADDKFPMTEICRDLAQKLFSKLAPFPVTESFADDEGVWLMGEPEL